MCFTKLVHNDVQDNLGHELTEMKFGENYDDICDYIEYDNLPKVKSTLSDLTIIFVNIRGILSKQFRLSKFLKHCLGHKKVDVIILAETWLTVVKSKYRVTNSLVNIDRIVMEVV